MTDKFDYSKIHPKDDTIIHRYGSNLDKTKMTMAPDGEAWEKCCRDDPNTHCNCSFIDKRMSIKHNHQAKYPFVCTHQTTSDGYYRVCAGWDCVFGNSHKDSNK